MLEFIRYAPLRRYHPGQIILPVAIAIAAMVSAPARAQSFVAFESGQVRPLALAPGGDRLFAVNTPDNRLEVFDVSDSGLAPIASVPVGMEPVAVAVRSDVEVWVVNHLSDSVSVVDVGVDPPVVTHTLLVGDEPRDIVFAGSGGNLAFISATNRDLPRPVTSTSGNADVYVFDATKLPVPLTVINLFGDVPRPLAVSPDGSLVYAGIHHSGNQTVMISEFEIGPGEHLPPFDNVEGVPAPETGLILKWNGTDWLDAGDRVWTGSVQKFLPDYDVFVIDADAAVPVEIDRISSG